ncbi:hypothetical protein MFIFM68171_10621 [Madurella fahalii]|uniref:Uncharacterized protein n=1 Tax=Madurella fahalii TaxID=1157608 RepID=A0ABQ0GRP5_9PEZI
MHFNHFVVSLAALTAPFGVAAAPPFTLPKNGTDVKIALPDGDHKISVDLGPGPAILKNTTGFGEGTDNLDPVVSITPGEPHGRILGRDGDQDRNETKGDDNKSILVAFAGGVAGGAADGAGGGVAGAGAGILFGLAKPKMREGKGSKVGKGGRGGKGRKGGKAKKAS